MRLLLLWRENLHLVCVCVCVCVCAIELRAMTSVLLCGICLSAKEIESMVEAKSVV
jgi:hypothetical protein